MLVRLILLALVKTELGQAILVDLYKRYIMTVPVSRPYSRKDYNR